MITKDEALNAIAVKHGHKDWELARYRLGELHLHVLILEAMELYASQSNSHKQVVSGKRPLIIELLKEFYTNNRISPEETADKILAACASGTVGMVAEGMDFRNCYIRTKIGCHCTDECGYDAVMRGISDDEQP